MDRPYFIRPLRLPLGVQKQSFSLWSRHICLQALSWLRLKFSILQWFLSVFQKLTDCRHSWYIRTNVLQLLLYHHRKHTRVFTLHWKYLLACKKLKMIIQQGEQRDVLFHLIRLWRAQIDMMHNVSLKLFWGGWTFVQKSNFSGPDYTIIMTISATRHQKLNWYNMNKKQLSTS